MPTTQTETRERRRLAPLLPWLILVAGLAFTGILARQLHLRETALATDEFTLRANAIATRLEHLLTANTQVLRGVAGLFAASDSVTRAEFHRYVEGLRLQESYPGIQAIGYAVLVPAAERNRHVAELRAEGLHDYAILPPGERERYSAVTYVEPLDWRNQRALGFDLLTEPVRATAAARACDEARVAMSEPVTLRQESGTDVQVGVLIFLPIYAPDQPQGTVAERRAALRGWAYAALRVRNAVNANLLAGNDALARQFAIRIEAPGATPADRPLYALNTELNPHWTLAIPRRIAFGGTDWTLWIAPLPAYLAAERALEGSRTVAVAGLLLTLAMALATGFLTRSHLRLAAALSESGRANRELAERTRELAASEGRVRAKLDALLAPEGDLATLDLADIVDTATIQGIMEEFHRLIGLGVALVDLEGRVLVKAGWQPICTRFHRVHPITAQHCVESDSVLSRGVVPDTYRAYRCKNGLWDLVTPLLIGGRHIGNLFLGQFFFEDEPPDRAVFRAQARQFGFDEAAYLAALDTVPRRDRERIDAVMHFYMRFAGLISRLSHANIQLARALAEQQRIDAALRTAKDQAEAASRSKSAFLANMSHEIRTPLNAILGFAQVLGHDPAIDPDRQAHLASIQRNGEHLLGLLSDILDMAKIEAGRMTLRVGPVDLHQLLSDTLATFRTRAADRGLALNLQTTALPARVLADRLRLLQVLMNLIGNALKFTDRGSVTLSAEAVAGGVRFSVTDTGIGIGTEDLGHIFEPFTQATLGARGIEGAGLGLALCDQYVRLMGGALTVESAPGQGSRFGFTIPLPPTDPGLSADRGLADAAGGPDQGEAPRPGCADAGHPPPLSAAAAGAHLARCPPDWQAALRTAVHLGDFRRISALVGQIREADPRLHALLTRWAYNFALEPFTDLLGAQADTAPDALRTPTPDGGTPSAQKADQCGAHGPDEPR